MRVIDPTVLEVLPTLDRWQQTIDVPELMRRAEGLPRRDRLLLELVFRDGLSHREVADVMRIPRGSISRRVRRLLRRVNDPLVVAVGSETCPLPRNLRALALRVYRDRVRLRELAREHDVAVTTLRKRLLFVRAWFDGLRQGPRWLNELSASAEQAARKNESAEVDDE